MLYMQKKKKSLVLMITIKKYHKLKDHCHYTGKCTGATQDICNLKYKFPKEITVVFHNGYHMIIIL